jgi:predicted ArsR family transcriptional regulator
MRARVETPAQKRRKSGIRATITAYIKQRKEFTIPELVEATGIPEKKIRRAIKWLMRRGIVRVTDEVRLSGPPGKETPAQIYQYVG